MSVWKMFSTNRKFLLPVVITVSLLVAFLGMRVPNYAKPLKNKSSTRAVLEVQAKETKEGLNKSGQLVALRGNISTFAPTTFYIDAFHHQTRCSTSILVTSAPARASPPVYS
jgi:hypothetical protein